MNNPQLPYDAERSLLGVLETEQQKVSAYLATCPLGTNTSVMAPWITGLDQFAWSFLQRAPLASWLTRQGLPQAEQVLQKLMSDLSGARKQYVAMYLGIARTESEFSGIWNEAVNFATQNILAATRYSQAVFGRWQEDYFDITEERCYACHQPLGIPGGGYHFSCARRLGLI
jgi:hypothetical protein